ncbi:MAG: hypothetical protein C0167_03090, partial [Nitrososphaera sp.]
MNSEGGAVRIRITRRGFLKLGAATAAAVAVASVASKIPFSRAVMMNDDPSSATGQSTSSGLYPVYCRAGGSACSLQLSVDSSGRPVWIRPNLASPQAGECGRGASGGWLG